MRKCKALVLSIAVSALFMSCGEKEASIRFNISGAVALGATGGTGSSVQRSVLFSREAEEDPVSIVKLTESGEVENATEITGEVDLANVNSIFKSPYSKDMYLWFDGLTRNTLNNGPVLTPLVCIHNDNTYTDLLRQETKYSNYLTFRKQDNIDFDDKGNAYFIGDDGGPYEIYVYKFDVNTRERTTLYSQISNYDPSNTLDVIWCLRVSGDGKYLYLSGSYSKKAKYFVRVMPLDNPEEYIDIEETDGGNHFSWAYSRSDNKLYVSNSGSTDVYSADGQTKEKHINDVDYKCLIPASNGIVFGLQQPYDGAPIFEKLGESEGKEITPLEGGHFSAGDICYKQSGDWIYIITDFYDDEWPDYNNGYETVYGGVYFTYLKCFVNYKIYRLNINSMKYEDVLTNCEYEDNLYITSWDVTDSKLYYTSIYSKLENNKAVQENVCGVVDLSDLSHTRISENDRLSSLAAM